MAEAVGLQALQLRAHLRVGTDAGGAVDLAGDGLELRFWGIENFRLRVQVDLEGRAFVPKVGYLTLKEKTLAEAEKMMRASVAKYFPKLDFGLTLVEPRTLARSEGKAKRVFDKRKI